ncbi:NAD(P)H-dependent oxidoreductase [Paenibacillus sp. IB182496]|uniref:NAD(P)H-dependent oxidoreductase n=1 Tax=Paenibacillus sabuli TaxID=2772509 RepID=A0A927BYD2_9BACL|nr:NAD(P)H-dependent oxidoreductase [Paenibacillus sabuli]MBD2847583.1 NAD(P)H-dependent oxidoreductase [Paenibacillus sabuli]
MPQNMLIVNGHPYAQSYCAALADAYAAGARAGGANVQRLELHELKFDPNLRHGYASRMELEPDLVAAQEQIRRADHLVWVYPIWWGAMPAQLKGFIDRVFLPGFAYKYRTDSVLWDKLLQGKSARLIVTMDTPGWYNRLFYKQAGHIVMKRNILGFCGIKPVRITSLGPVRGSSDTRRARWLEQVKLLGRAGK